MGKKKKNGKKGKKGKKKADDSMTWEEALLAYKISLVERSLEDARYELRAQTEMNERNKERNERLQLEQKEYISILLRQAKENKKEHLNDLETEKEQVVVVMKDKWKAARQEEKNIVDLKEQIARKATTIAMEEHQVEYWTEYRNLGKNEHHMQIKLLEQELDDMQNTFNEMAGHLNRSLTKAKNDIQGSTDEALTQQKYLATEKAMAMMDKYSRQEVKDNDWLKREVAIHQKDMDDLMLQVAAVEEDNLNIMSQLFECHVDDLKISRDFFLTQFGEGEEVEGFLEDDITQSLSLVSSNQTSDRAPVSRPKSAIQRSVEDRVRSVHAPSKGDTEEDYVNGDFDGVPGEEGSSEDPFDKIFLGDEHFEDYLRLGPLELKMLNVNGRRMNLIKPDTPPEVKSLDWRPDEWPITNPMLQKVAGVTPRK